MHAHVAEYLQALADLAATPASDATHEARFRAVTRAERRKAVNGSPLVRLLVALDVDPVAAWALRFAVGRALATWAGLADEAAFRPSDLAQCVGSRVGGPIEAATLLSGPRTERLRQHGLLVRDNEGRHRLGHGFEQVLSGGPLPLPPCDALEIPDRLRDHPAVQRFGRSLAEILGSERVPTVVLRGLDPLLAAAVVARVAETRGRRSAAWRLRQGDIDEGDPLAAVAWAAALEGTDLLLSAPNDGGFVPSDCLGESQALPLARPGGNLFLHREPEDPLLARLLDAPIVLDLEPLRRLVEDQPSPTGDPVERHRAERWHAVHAAVYPERGDALHDDLLRLARPPEFNPFDREPRPEEERWQMPEHTLDELVLDTTTRRALDGVVRVAREGRRCVVLLHGPPGTGKSFAARCLAGSLERPVYELDGSAIRGKYFGELERNLRRVFEALRERSAVLVIDEADAFVGRREGSMAAVGSGSITECAELLVHLERYQGVAVLTTNRQETLDPALRRRVDAWIALDLPDAEGRLALWGAALPDPCPISPIELTVLAAVPLSGGEIRATVVEAMVTSEELTAVALLEGARRRSEQRRTMGG